MRILMASSEMSSLARTGGLGDVLDALPPALLAEKHEVSVVLPFYRAIRENPLLRIRDTGVEFRVQIGEKTAGASIFETMAPHGTQVFLVRRDEYFDRSGIYGADGRDYQDNAERFIFFCKAVVELACRMEPVPEVLHVHDWQTALIPALIRAWGLPLKTVCTIHNLAYQGSYWGVDFGLTNLPGSYFSASGLEFFGNMNLLKGGIVYSDAVVAVSEPYLREIKTPQGGFGLDAVVRENAAKFRGILNGADYDVWNPATDKFLPQTYDSANFEGKKACREALLIQLKLTPGPRGPVFGMVTRLAEQKGFDLLLPILDRLLSGDVRLIILGEGDPGYEAELRLHLLKHRGKFAFQQEFNEPLSHLIEAGSDIQLIPSHFEPCGLSAIYSLKYGAIPVARAVGGLSQIICDYDPADDSGWGFLFHRYDSEALWDAVKRAWAHFLQADRWEKLVRQAMNQDFSWKLAAKEYSAIYRQLMPPPAPVPTKPKSVKGEK